MSAKQLLPDQCVPLHYFYGSHDCCLCKSNGETILLQHQIEELERQLAETVARGVWLWHYTWKRHLFMLGAEVGRTDRAECQLAEAQGKIDELEAEVVGLNKELAYDRL